MKSYELCSSLGYSCGPCIDEFKTSIQQKLINYLHDKVLSELKCMTFWYTRVIGQKLPNNLDLLLNFEKEYFESNFRKGVPCTHRGIFYVQTRFRGVTIGLILQAL